MSNPAQGNFSKCKVCGLGDIEGEFSICDYCAWEDDDVQNKDPDFEGGANQMSLNQYKQFWEENKEKIMKEEKRIEKAIELSILYYNEHFK